MLTGVDSEYDLYADTPESERPGARRPVIDAPPDAPGRSRRATDHEARGAYRRLRDQFLRRWAASGEECFFGDHQMRSQSKHLARHEGALKVVVRLWDIPPHLAGIRRRHQDHPAQSRGDDASHVGPPARRRGFRPHGCRGA